MALRINTNAIQLDNKARNKREAEQLKQSGKAPISFDGKRLRINEERQRSWFSFRVKNCIAVQQTKQNEVKSW
jgi:hypothetical protein